VTRWGKSWIVLPNPAYGSWECSLYGFKDGIPPDSKAATKESRLIPWTP
jgi:predicted secreted acid phosphatase